MRRWQRRIIHIYHIRTGSGACPVRVMEQTINNNKRNKSYYSNIYNLSNIRVTYSGLIAFATGVASTLTGLVFVLIITRSLSPEEFGTWALIGNILTYFIVSDGVITFWTIRQIARGDNIGRTSVISSLFFSLLVIPLYTLVSYYVSDNSNAIFDAMLLGILLVPVFSLSRVLASINSAHRPQVVSYSNMIFEIAKVPAVILAVYIMDMGLYGAIISLFVAYVSRLGTQFYFARKKLCQSFKLVELRRWIKLSWITVYYTLSRFVMEMDVVVYTLITGSVNGVAYFGVAMAIAGIVMHSSQVTQALYPKLLSQGKIVDFQENFILLLYFAIPILGIVIIFSKPAMFVLNPIYSDGYVLAIFFGIKTLFLVFNEVFRSVLLGIEDVDAEKNASFKLLAKSMLLFSSSVWLVKSIISIVSLIAILYITNTAGVSEIDLVINWSITILSMELMFFVYLVIFLRKKFRFTLQAYSALRYVVATGIFVVIYYMTSDYILDYQEDTITFILRIIVQLVLCVGLYVVVTYAIDKRTRSLVGAILNCLGPR